MTMCWLYEYNNEEWIYTSTGLFVMKPSRRDQEELKNESEHESLGGWLHSIKKDHGEICLKIYDKSATLTNFLR